MLRDIRRVESVADCPEPAWPIYQYWLAKRGSKPMPARSDIDPTEIPARLLSSLQLVDVVGDERRYVYRLNGATDVRVRGHDPRGKPVREGFWGPSAEDAVGCYDRVVAERAPVIDPVAFSDGHHISEFTLFLPLSDDGSAVNIILIYSIARELRLPDLMGGKTSPAS